MRTKVLLFYSPEGFSLVQTPESKRERGRGETRECFGVSLFLCFLVGPFWVSTFEVWELEFTGPGLTLNICITLYKELFNQN